MKDTVSVETYAKLARLDAEAEIKRDLYQAKLKKEELEARSLTRIIVREEVSYNSVFEFSVV